MLSTHDPDHALACASRVQLLATGIIQAGGIPADGLTGNVLSHIHSVPISVSRLGPAGNLSALRMIFGL